MSASRRAAPRRAPPIRPEVRPRRTEQPSPPPAGRGSGGGPLGHCRPHQSGAALILALFAAALATLLATRMLERTDILIGTIEGRHLHAQAVELTRGGVDYARAVLMEDQRRSVTDHAGEPWATPLPPLEATAGAIKAAIGGRIEDVQGRWNINNLRTSTGAPDPVQLALFRRLLAALSLDETLAAKAATRIAAPGTELGELGALSTVSGFDAAALAALASHVVALPGPQPVNVNTATAPVLMALLPGLDASGARQLVVQRDRVPWRDLADFRAALSSGLDGNAGGVPMDVRSQFFLVRVRAVAGRAAATQEALLHRDATARWPSVLWRHYL